MLFEEMLSEDEYFEELNELIFDFIDTLDFETLSEEQITTLDNLLEFITEIDFTDDEEIDTTEEDEKDLEEAVRKRVVRKGKIVRKLMCKPGYKGMGNRCVKMSASERRVRRKVAKKSARLRKSKSASIQRHRARSMRIAKRI